MKLPRINLAMKNASSAQQYFVKAAFLLLMIFTSFQQLSAQSSDIDGDGITNSLDLDDDNDGILDADECQASNKISAGVFPTSGSTIPGWTTTGLFALNARGLQFDADNAVTTVRQTVSSVFFGSTINLNNVRWLTTNNAAASGRLITEILYGGTVYATIDTGVGVAGSIPTVTGNNGAVTNISILPSIASTGVYSTPSNIIISLPSSLPSSGEFQIRFTSGSTNADDLSIESVQLISCSDFDGDGIPNFQDLDSDGDGCSDAVEGSGNFTTSQLITASGTLTTQTPNINFGTAVDANGIPTIVGASGQGIGDSLDVIKDCKDSDGDGIPDWQDLDDDNDGILDCVENGLNTTVDKIFKANNNATLIASPSSGPVHQYRLTNGGSQNGQIWSYGKVDFTKSFTLSTKALLSDADGIAIVFHKSPAGQLASGTNGQGLGARGIANGIALELDTFVNSCTNDANNGANCDPTYDHGSIRTTVDWINAGKLAGDGQLGDGTVDDGLWHDVVINWNSVTRNLSYTFDGVAVTNYTFPATGANAIETILAGNSAYFGFTASTGGAGSNNSVGFDSLCTLPIYLDTDRDGISNHLDLDSDGDGCTDAIEGAGNFTTSQLTAASGNISTQNPNQNFGITVDGNGVPTTVGAAGQGIGESQDISKNDCIDSDGDGYPDWQDLDDDNDGILDTVECSVTDLVTNGTFTGSANGWTLENSWTYNTNRVANSADGETSRLLQSISNLDKFPGNIVPLTFTVGAQDASNASGNSSALEIRLNGVVYATINNGTLRDNSNVTITLEPGVMSNFTTFGTSPLNGYNTQTFTLWIPYTGPSTANLVFRKVGGNDDWLIDNVSIPAMICDTDGDGILDHLDLDSDGDGCSDAIEGDAAFTTSNLLNSSMPGGNTGGSYTGTAGPVTSNLGNTVGNTAATMGVPTIAGTGQGVGGSKIATNYSQCLDSDVDGIPDWQDLDDDNDGILDTAEICKSAISTDFFGGQTSTVTTVNSANVVATTATITPAITDYFIGWHMGNAAAAVGKEMSINFSNPVYLATDGVDFILNGMDAPSKFGHFFIVYEDGTRLSNLNLSLANISPANGILLSSTNGANSIETQAAQASADLRLLGVDRTKRIVKIGYTVLALNGGALSETIRPRIQIDCDIDGDGIPNQLDLDSDNDGCLDAIEGGANITTSQLVNSGGVLSVGTGSAAANRNLCANNTCVDANGVPTIVNGGQTAGTSTNKDVQDVMCLTPFDCTSGMYISQDIPTTLYRADTSAYPITYPVAANNSSGIGYNAIGFNPIDGFIYGLINNTNTLIRIDKNGVFNTMGNISPLVATNYNSGEIDNLGNYYVKAGGANAVLYKINLQTLTSTAINLSQSINIPDMAFSSVTNLFYAVDQTSEKLVSINPVNGNVTFIGSAISPSVFGAMFGSSTGTIYGSENSGGLYQFNLITGQRVLISASPSSSNNDGAHCVTSPITFTADLEVTKTDNKTVYVPGTNNIYTIVVKNNGPFGVLGATVSDLVPAGIPAANVSYTVPAVTGGATSGIVTSQTGAINDVVNIPSGGTITYTVTVAVPLGFTGNLTNTVTVSLPADTIDLVSANNTATDTDNDTSVCYKPAIIDAANTYPSKHGITSLGRAGAENSNWPMVRQSAWSVLEAKTKGFVINRVKFNASNQPVADNGTTLVITSPVEGMIVYDTTNNCLKVYTSNNGGSTFAWHCISAQTCPN
ncbi:hypothetical protein [Epilithonimonas sp.]|uniref:DUF6923 family protein n=1 Tax=Epilithonimonas sp. TaxID=2894511 RepID=UPI0035AF04C8